jgi:protocatechuate 3,4-dioxygenase beta subunit
MITRRDLLKRAGAASAAAFLVSGCETSPSGLVDAGTLPGRDGGGHDPLDAPPLLDATPECAETEDNLEGPFYREGAPFRSVLVEEAMLGTRLSIVGRVLGLSCIPLAGAVLDFWQADWRADETGRYDNAGYTLRGRMKVDEQGRYELKTIIPGRYLNGNTYRPAHIHVKASASGHVLLTTQLYFAGDPFNEKDPFIEPPLIMSTAKRADGSQAAQFDFVLRPST